MNQPNANTQTLIQLWTQTNALVRQLDAHLGAVHGLGFAEYMALHHLNAAPQLMLRRIDLARVLCRSASGVTKMLNPMEKVGLVSKQVNPRDARVSLVKLTAAGLRSYQQANNSLNQLSAGVFQHLDTADAEQLHGLLSGLST
ncbi:MarR family winged helix-turn-helix transcriptional regulator [Marinicella meishanensis]|uniref:MarR family winged helix-turn-helix transcriptional regulator n=1 Tax=Marinicella meishanensis TaxID=2873263 RepID=UPI001CBE5E18|nr:MarR family transcriptional regulator [Marinicella sp. NBU2979]